MKGRRRPAPLALALLGATLLAAPVAGATAVADALATAHALEASGNVDAARAVLEEVVATAPADPAPYNALAVLLARQGELARARDLLDAALRTDAAYAGVYANLQAVLGALAARAYARALDDETLPPDSLELAAVAPGASETIPALVMRVPVVPLPEIPPVETTTTGADPAPAPASPATPDGVSGPVTTAAVPGSDHVADSGAGLAAERVAGRVRDWARAWSAQDVTAYLAFYSERFRPGRGLSLDAWRAQRRERVARPGHIDVAVGDLDVRIGAPDRARARFRQTYRSDRLHSTVVKTLDLAREDGEWRIVREAVR